ncbi:MAG: hypothetical protein RLZZ238_1043, partial [Planctomycetota bacterium]
MSLPARESLLAWATAALSVFVAAECPAQIDPLSVFEPSLKIIPVPAPTTLNEYIADYDAAVRLG